MLTLPQELLIDRLLPILSISDVCSLCRTCHNISKHLEDELFWMRRCEADFRFSTSRLTVACNYGWRRVYKALATPELYAWGDTRDGRLHVENISILRDGGAPYPIRVPMPMKSIVDIQGTGWCYCVLDSKGQVYVWGTMDTWGNANEKFWWNRARTAHSPMHLMLPTPIGMLRCGEKHVMALDIKGYIWVFLSWGCPFRIITPLLNSSSRETTIVQIECGTHDCYALTESGAVYMFSPFKGAMAKLYVEKLVDMHGAEDALTAKVHDQTIPCTTWDLPYDLEKLPDLPDNLPRLQQSDGSETKEIGLPKITMIAALRSYLVGVTNQGHVLKFRLGSLRLEGLAEGWTYLPEFSEFERIQRHLALTTVQDLKPEGNPPIKFEATHVMASHNLFAVYSLVSGASDLVLMGDSLTKATSSPHIIPELQHRSVVALSFADGHRAALSADGRVYTWGRNRSGALGIMNNLRAGEGRFAQILDTPTQVIFDPKKSAEEQPFCFAVLAAGIQMAALVLDLNCNLKP